MEEPNRSIETPASQASSGKARFCEWPDCTAVLVPTEYGKDAYYCAKHEPYTSEDVGQLMSWISDTLEAHDHAGKPFLQAINLIATLDDESITGIFGDDEEKLTPQQKRIMNLAKVLADTYKGEGVLE